ncbi:MAG: gamma carbonic anhydrase family protein [Candidatus Nanopelagicales bacterium]
MPIYELNGRSPQIHENAFVHPDAVLIGDVRIGANSSIWPSAVLRGDSSYIEIGQDTSIQDGSIIHCQTQFPTIIGSRCVVGHNTHLEGCVIEDKCLIGSGSTVLEKVLVKKGALVAAQSLVPPGKIIPEKALALGVPVKIKENAVDENSFEDGVNHYLELTKIYKNTLKRIN